MKRNSSSSNKTKSKRGSSKLQSKLTDVSSEDEQPTSYALIVVMLWGVLFFVSPLFVFDFAEGYLGGFAWFIVILYVVILLKLFVLKFGTGGAGHVGSGNGSLGGGDGGGGCGGD